MYARLRASSSGDVTPITRTDAFARSPRYLTKPREAQMTVITSEKHAIALRLHDLEAMLIARGLSVTVEEDHGALVAANTVAVPDDPADRLAIAYGPAKLMQRVVLKRDDQAALYWYWQWSGPTRDAQPEYERLAPAAAIAETADRITRVLALSGQR
jgi:hypothetical protein